jgi:putative salt-induced outer membrane protein YdiY
LIAVMAGEGPTEKMRKAALVIIMVAVCGTHAAASWQPPEPDPNAWDWIRLNSGEWLGGNLELLRDRELEFDSDELDLLKLDWTDVAELRSPRILTYRFENRGNFTGTAVMRGDTVAIRTESGLQHLPHADLILIMEGSLRERNYWSARATIGAVGRAGNTEQSDLNSNLRVRRLTPRTRAILDYAGNYGRVQDTQTINNHNLSLSFDMLVKAGFFVTPLSANFMRDPFTNIDMKSTLGAGVGYVIMRDGDVDWSVGLGAGYQSTSYHSVEAGQDKSSDNGTIMANTAIEWDITGDVECLFDYDIQMGVPDVSTAFHHARLAFSFDIFGDILDLDLSWIWDRVESPRPDADGVTPERDDFRTTIGIGLDI